MIWVSRFDEKMRMDRTKNQLKVILCSKYASSVNVQKGFCFALFRHKKHWWLVIFGSLLWLMTILLSVRCQQKLTNYRTGIFRQTMPAAHGAFCFALFCCPRLFPPSSSCYAAARHNMDNSQSSLITESLSPINP